VLQQLKVAFSHAGESARTVVGIRRGIEEPLYILEPLIKHVEVRHYGPRLAAQTTVAGDELPARSEGLSAPGRLYLRRQSSRRADRDDRTRRRAADRR